MKKLTYFGQKCAEMRKRLGITQVELADKMGFDQGYLSKLENGHKPLNIQLIRKYLAAFQELGKKTSNQRIEDSGMFSLVEQFEFTREIFDHADNFEIKLSDVSIIHRNNLTRLMAILTLDEYFPEEVLDSSFISWMQANRAVNSLKTDPEEYKPGPLELGHRFDGYYKNKN